MILITTVGKVGALAARLLAAQGKPVRVLVPNPDNSSARAHARAEVVQRDPGVAATIDGGDAQCLIHDGSADAAEPAEDVGRP
jgi:uncharacterized protein YbjT (DUF2867 family)